MGGKQSIKKRCLVHWAKKRRYRKQRGKGFPLRFLASAAAPFISKVAKPLLKRILVVEKEEEYELDNEEKKVRSR